MEDRLEQYRNYLQSIQYHQEYGDKYGDTKELIEMYERKLNMKEPYIWGYTIRVKTKEGTYQSEIIKCDKCKMQLSEVFIQQSQYGTLKLCKNCNERYLKYMENVKKLEKVNEVISSVKD